MKTPLKLSQVVPNYAIPKTIQRSFSLVIFYLFFLQAASLSAQDQPNILLVIADDLGVDVSNGYHTGGLMPTTPTLDSLRSVGITFENVFANPKCTPTRASIMSGKFGVKTGVTATPGNLDLVHTSIFKALAAQTSNEYADAVIGKWHISSPADPNHPLEHDIDYYMGMLSSSVADYYAWQKTENGATTTETNYATTVLTDAAIDWVNDQTQPWFLWFAHVAPHSPFHVPPSHMYSINATGTNYRKYIAMIESIDFELNRLLYSMPEAVRNNTIIIYIGDNGTPGSVLQDYPMGHGKSTLYQGGIRVPMIVAGAGVTRMGEREAALVNVNDIHATILDLAGGELPGGVFNSLSFAHLLKGEAGDTRKYNYAEIMGENKNGWTMREERYKLIKFTDGTEEMYDLLLDSLEIVNLLDNPLTAEQLTIKEDLEAEGIQTRDAWSCRDFIKNGDEEGIDCGGTYCTPCQTTGLTNAVVDISFDVHPNPTSDFLSISNASQKLQELTIYSILGERLLQIPALNQRELKIDLSGLAPQTLLVEIQFPQGVKTVKVVKE
ncbi:MAG: sulfatase-like hydrolase/transferase [Saprospiraceae bacterium]